jgi:hypothetical protein
MWNEDHTDILLIGGFILAFVIFLFLGSAAEQYMKKPYQDAVLTCSLNSQQTEFCTKLIDKLGK